MCAICGVYHSEPERPVDQPALERMARSMRHRGPDGEGFHVDGPVGLGHQRLSIVDLSDDGAQPMTNGRGLWIVFNGEIYNHIELREELRARGVAFRSRSDTEVLLALFELHGQDCLAHLNGMFAFAVWNAHTRELFLARDRLGIKPLYYTHSAAGFAFASEIKALLHAGVVTPAVDDEALKDYLTFQLCLGDKTLFQGVKKLPPGTWLTVRPDGTTQQVQYWAAPFEIDMDRSEAEYEEELRALLDDSVRLRLRADVAVGAHLSGGLDSSLIASLAGPRAPVGQLATFSGGFREDARYDETAYARHVVEAIGSDHTEVFPTAQDFVDLLPSLIYALDEPVAGPGSFPQLCIARAARERVKVVLTGHGGDEIFGGYQRYLVLYLERSLKGAIEGSHQAAPFVVSLESIVPNLSQLRGYEPLLQHLWSSDLFGPEERRYFRLVDRSQGLRPYLATDVLEASGGYSPYDAFCELFNASGCDALINRMTWFDMRTLLQALLQVEDRVSMASSIEARIPLLDHRIIELAGSMPPRIKFQGGRAKHVLRRVARGVVPPQVHGRVDKMGFPVPLAEWARGGPVRDFLGDVLLSSAARQRGLVDTGRVEALFSSEQAYGRGLWGLLCLELWMQTFIDGLAVPAS